jgi:uncharacterized membrane protein HdeD (DUF308 family)
MPVALRLFCFLAIGTQLAFALVSLGYEEGLFRFTTPALCVGIAFLIVFFMQRRQWTWSWMMTMSLVMCIINLLFLPEASTHGKFLIAARVVAFFEITSGFGIFAMMRWSERTRMWFHEATSP